MKVKSTQIKSSREKAPSAESAFCKESVEVPTGAGFLNIHSVRKSDSCSLRIRVPVIAGIWVVPRKSSSLFWMRAIFFCKKQLRGEVL